MKRHINYQFPGFRVFFDPDNGGGGGQGGAPAAQPAPAAGDGGDGGGGGEGDLLTLAPPDVDLAAAFLSDKGDATKPPAPGTKPGAAPKPGVPPAPAPAPAKGEPPAAQLRKELEATKAELASAKTRLESGDPRVKDLEASVQAKEKELASEKTRAQQYREKLLALDPEVAEEIVTMDEEYNKVATKFYRSVPLEKAQVESLLLKYHRLPTGAEHATARAAWEQEVNEAMGAQDGNDHRKLGTALDFIEKTHDFAVEREQARKKVQQEATTREFEGSVKKYTTKATRVDDLISKAGQVPEDLRTANPLHPDVVLDTFIKVLPEESQKKLKEGIAEFTRLAIAGLKPRSSADYAGMSPQEVEVSRQEEQSRAAMAQDHAVKIIHQGALALRVMPAMWKEIQRLRAKVKEDFDGTPPDPTEGSGGGGGEDEMAALKALTPPDVTKLNFLG